MRTVTSVEAQKSAEDAVAQYRFDRTRTHGGGRFKLGVSMEGAYRALLSSMF